MRKRCTLIFGLALIPAVGAAQAYVPTDSATVVPGAHFSAGGLHRFFFGTRYRDLWTTPIRVPVLQLARFGGGLKPTERGGGQQTKSLRLQGGDGREYQFRSVAKDPRAILPSELRESFAADLLLDQMSSAHPAGALVVSPILEAAGVLHTKPLLVQMADSPDLGEYRADFAGLLGTIEERPREFAAGGATFAGARAIVSTQELLDELDKDPEVQVNAPAFLLARLTDVMVGDWDRHADQWRWARIGSKGAESWHPIPRDRDQAFVRFDGFILSQARRSAPQLLNFGPGYGGVSGATWNGRNLDRRFLTGLERLAWDSVTAILKGRLTDRVLADAVRQLPAALYAKDGGRMEAALRSRRDQLDAIAGKYYRLLAGQVDVVATDKSDDVRVLRRADGLTEITLGHKGNEYFRRAFRPGETREIRLYLQGAGDNLAVEGAGGGPTLRVIGGGGDDEFSNRSRGGVHLYDDRGANRAAGAGINRKPWWWKPDTADPTVLPPRDWGRKTVLQVTGSYGPDIDAVLGYSGHTDWYGFRHFPYATRVDYGLEGSTGKRSGRARLGITRQFENSSGFLELRGLASGIESLRWYGFSNESAPLQGPDDASFYRVGQTELSAMLRLGVRFGARNRFAVGPMLRWSQTKLTDPDNAARFIALDNPYGTRRFGLVGLGAELLVDGRDQPKFATRGASFRIEATAYPGLLDADKALGRVDAEGSFTVAPSGSWRPSLNLMAGGSKTWGKLPFFVAPTLGGSRTLRGYRPDRFAGNDAVYASAEARIPLTRIKFVVPGQQGIFGFTDVGRVYVEGESSDTWHSTFGGGVWFSFLSRSNVVLVGAGKPTKGSEGVRLIVGFGFPY